LFGHGFYQFSPELFYSVLAPHNGFRIIKMAIVESYYADVMPPENNKMAIAAGETNVIQ
jgi:hypothetical protein